MKTVNKVILAFFSVLIFLESVVIICISTNLLGISIVNNVLVRVFENNNTGKAVLVLAIICLLSSIKCIFFDGEENKTNSKGILMQNDNGKLLISKTTIENIVTSTVKNFPSVEGVEVDTGLTNTNELIVNVNLVVNKNAIIKDLTLNLQNKIKESIKRISDLDVKEVNVKIKDIITEKKE